MPRSFLAFPLLAFALAGCATKPPARPAVTITAPPPTKADEWLHIASPADADRIARVSEAWRSGLAEARSHGALDEIRKEGRLLDPAAAQPRPAPTPGSYSCRLVKLGSAQRKGVAFERFKPFFCYVQVEGDLLTIVKQTGSQRPAGRLWDDDVSTRLVYLGSLALGEEDQPKAYGEDPGRDMAGLLERIAPFVWRLVIPFPRNNAKLDVYELTPVADQPK
ncbi:MAG: DUF4893 domain-containing protein [Pseudomonadota bacterium]|nr:DUF4893 domain-containing protein [Pseudomonadota bacterium]